MNLNPRKNILYLLPSFPPEVNKKNKDLLLKKLHELYISNPQEWKEQIVIMLHSWRAFHELKIKHFNIADREMDRELLRMVVGETSRVMEKGMRETLENSRNE